MFTDEQHAAIFTQDKNLVVVAGAGSGKTHVLVERYIALLRDNPAWPLNALVAITFTREAALEMRNRVRRKLEEEVRAAAELSQQRRWADLLAQMDSARIDTIHGLCATILRANAAEARVDPAFNIIDEVDSDILRNDIITAELQNLVDEDDDTAMLFTEYDMRSVREVLSNPELLSAPLAQAPTEALSLFEQWRDEWVAHYRAEWDKLVNDGVFVQAGEWTPPGTWPEDDKLVPSWITVHEHWANLFNENVMIAAVAVDALANGIDLRGGTAANWGGKAVKEEAKESLRTIRESLRDFRKAIGPAPGDLDFVAAEMLVRWYRLLARVQSGYRVAKQGLGVLDFNDLETRTARLLREHPAVRRRYQGAAFRRLLVDEFQDTNGLQWEIVHSLADIEGDTALFVVGDMKQSIYGFRGADVRVFGGVRHEIAQGEHDNGVELKLSRSFRSRPGLIDIFNRLFQKVLVRDEESAVRDYEIAFDPEVDTMTAHREVLRDDASSAYHPVELILLRRKHQDETVSAEERRLWEAEQLASRLHQLKQDAAPIFDKALGDYRPFNYNDVAILFQSTTAITTYEEVFKTLKLPFVTVGGRGYYNRQEVWDVLNLLRALHNPADNLSLAAALRSPMFGFSDDMLLALRLLRDEDNLILPLWDALAEPAIPFLSDTEQAQVGSAYRLLTRLRERAGRVTISELLRQALAETGYLAMLTGLPGGARLRRNIEKLIEIAERSGKITLGAFAYYLADLSDREVREGEAALDAAGAVRLMSVHASKGLEFPLVALADASWVRRGGERDLVVYDADKQRLACKVFDPEQRKHVPSYPFHFAQHMQQLRDAAERKRLLYVAATRARDCLIVSGSVSESKNGWTTRGWLKDLIDGLGAEGSQDGEVFPYVAPYGTVKVRLPRFDPDMIRGLRGGADVVEWRELLVGGDAEQPRQLQPLHIPEEQMLGHIAATQLAGLGGLRHAENQASRRFYTQQVRRQVLDDSEVKIRDAVRTRLPRIRARQIGDVVHEALQYWRFPDADDNIDAILRSYAWQQHITDEADVQDVVNKVHHLLALFQTSQLYQEITIVKAAGRPFYAEMPFIFRTEKRILHGVIDALYQREDGTWALVDYKTSYIPLSRMTPAEHAQRYHLQIGAYASAVQRELGQLPTAYVHYIQYNQTVEIPTAIWQAEIAQLEQYIGDLLG